MPNFNFQIFIKVFTVLIVKHGYSKKHELKIRIEHGYRIKCSEFWHYS